jgi:hypothetical protein
MEFLNFSILVYFWYIPGIPEIPQESTRNWWGSVKTSLKLKAINEFIDQMKLMLDEARAALAKSKDDMARYYNQQRTLGPQFVVGNKVFLDASDIHMTRPMKKFTHRLLGPYPIIRPVGSHMYHLKLPSSMS